MRREAPSPSSTEVGPAKHMGDVLSSITARISYSVKPAVWSEKTPPQLRARFTVVEATRL